MTHRHLSLFTPTYMYVVAVPGGSGTSCCFCNDREESARSPCTRVGSRRLLQSPPPPRNQNYPGNFQAAVFHHETDLRSGSGHQVPQKGESYPPRQRGGQIPATAITRRKTAEPLSGMFHADNEDVQRIPATARRAQRCNNKQPLFQISVPGKPLHPLKKRPRNASDIVHIST